MGKKTVTIENPLTLSGAVDFEFGNFTAGPEGGLSKAQQKVPGGVVGLTGLTWPLEFFSINALSVYATTELAGTPTNISASSVTLPLKAHLTNPAGLLGPNCYIGSNSNAIVLNNITGTTTPPSPNKPITGVEPELEEDGETGILHLRNGTFADNSFAAPGTTGCELKLFGFISIDLDPLVEIQAGLPSPAGTNEAVQEFDIELVNQELVY